MIQWKADQTSVISKDHYFFGEMHHFVHDARKRTQRLSVASGGGNQITLSHVVAAVSNKLRDDTLLLTQFYSACSLQIPQVLMCIF